MSDERRGGRRPRYYVGHAPVWASGRWGRTRARVTHCWATLRAEALYDQFLREGAPALKPGSRASVTVYIPIEGRPSHVVSPWPLEIEVLANPIWRKGRLFYRCPACVRRATRLYIPLSQLQPRCRRCWGLAYPSQSWSYRGGWWDRMTCWGMTVDKRQEQRRAARARYEARRAFPIKPSS